MTRLVAGVDPGTNGAVVVLDGKENVIMVRKVPKFTVKVKDKLRHRVDPVGLRDLFSFLGVVGVELIVIEAIHGSRPGNHSASTFVQGFNVGLIYMAALQSRIPVKTVAPNVWKRVMKVPGKDDREAFQRGIKAAVDDRFRTAKWTAGPRGGFMYDVAEAGLIGLYGCRFLLTNTDPENDLAVSMVWG